MRALRAGSKVRRNGSFHSQLKQKSILPFETLVSLKDPKLPRSA